MDKTAANRFGQHLPRKFYCVSIRAEKRYGVSNSTRGEIIDLCKLFPVCAFRTD